MRTTKYLSHNSFLFLLLILVPSISSAGLIAFPSSDSSNEPTESSESREEIVTEAKAECAADPESCGITLSSFLDNTGFAETEPNNHILGADALTFDTKYWGQLYSAEDQDWYYITTTEPNQILTVDFSVPGLSDITGWNISVRDSGGNIFSEVNSGFDGKPDTLLRTALSHTGTYYIVVRGDQLPYDYNIAAFLQFSQLTTEPIDVNFFDTEVEPNDSRVEANPLASNVTMMGLISNGLIFGSAGFNFEEDWFVYESEGNEILSIEFCARQDCEGGDWQATMLSESGIILAKGRADKKKKYYLGIRNPGRYFLRIGAIPEIDENGGVIHICTPDPAAEPVWHQYNFTVTSTKLPPLMSEVGSL